MDVSELRKRILRAIDDARKEAETRRTVVDESLKAYEAFLRDIAVPLMLQAAQVLNADGHVFVVHTPLTQSVATEHSPLVAQRGHDAFGPPQSMSVSVPFLTPSRPPQA